MESNRNMKGGKKKKNKKTGVPLRGLNAMPFRTEAVKWPLGYRETP